MTDTPANHRGWGNPDSPGYREKHIGKVHVAGVNLNVRKEVADLFVGFIGELTAGGYRLNVRADDWGYANRDVRGRPGVKSNHAWGLAIDLNSATNPMTSDGRNHTDLPPGVGKLAAKYGLRWGGDYSGERRDPMHFEFIGTPADAQAYSHHLFKRSTPKPPASNPKELDVDEKTLRKIISEEVGKHVATILRDDATHKDSLASIHEDTQALRKNLKA